MIEISELYIHPIKSCRGISVRHAKLNKTGFAFDRQFVVVNAATGKFISGRTSPLLALVSPSLPPSLLDPSHVSSATAAGAQEGTEGLLMTVHAPGMPDLTIDLTPLIDQRIDHSTKADKLSSVSVWEWKGLGEDQGDEAATWFSDYLKLPCRLIRYCGTSNERGTDEPQERMVAIEGEGEGEGELKTVRFTDPVWSLGNLVAFSDGFPLLITNQASLADLSKRAGEELSMRRFRPNIVVKSTPGSTLSAWEEDEWLKLNITSSIKSSVIELECVKPCTRCKFTTLCPETATFGEEPLESLGEFRTGKDLGWDQVQKSMKHEVVFGNNAILSSRSIDEWISVGDKVDVVEKGRPSPKV